MNKISEFDVCTYRNSVVFELINTENLEPEAHERMIEILHDIIQNEFADKIRLVFDDALTEEHSHNSQNRGAF